MRKLLPILLIGVFTITQSCHNAKITQVKNNFEVLLTSEYGGVGEIKTQIFTDKNNFDAFWGEVNLDPSLVVPEIDFDQKMVIAHHFASQRSGGNQIKIHDVQYYGNEINVLYSAQNPSEFGTMAITSPIIVLVVDKVNNPKINFYTHK